MNEAMLRLLLVIPVGTKLRVGKAMMELEEIVADGSQDTGIVEDEVLIAGGLAIENARAVTFNFLGQPKFLCGTIRTQ